LQHAEAILLPQCWADVAELRQWELELHGYLRICILLSLQRATVPRSHGESFSFVPPERPEGGDLPEQSKGSIDITLPAAEQYLIHFGELFASGQKMTGMH